MTHDIEPDAAPALTRSAAKRRIIAGLCLAAAVCAGCAGARVQNVQAADSLTLVRPGRVIVYDFNTGPTDVQVPDEGASELVLSQGQPDLLADAVADSLAIRLVDDIRSLGLPAERAAGAASPEVNDLVIEGDFVRVAAGSRTARFVIGFGAGASELQTQVRFFRVTAEGWEPVKQFETVTTRTRLPGMAFGAAAGAAAGAATRSAATSSGVGVVREFRAGIAADAGRTAEQIVGRVSELKTEQSW